MKAKERRPRNVAVVLNLALGSHRGILHGISRAVSGRDGWNFRVMDEALWRERRSLREVASDWADGVITTSPDDPDSEEAQARRRGPVVVVGTPLAEAPAADARGMAFMGLDELGIGRAGADYLLSLGRFRSFGFVRGSDSRAAQLRAEGFVARLRERGADVRVFGPDADSGRAEPMPLASWLRALPRPRAVMANTDGAATVVLAAAATARLRIPRDLALIGCDNDELLCESTSPTLTSLEPNHVRLGEMAAAALRRLFARPETPYFEGVCSDVRVVARQSARPIPPGSALAERAATLIREGAAGGARVSDIVRTLGVSRSLAGMRYREVMGETMRESILRRRLDAVKRKLRETDMAVGQIAASCGFRSEAHARRLFRARFGCSMRQWRRGAGDLTRRAPGQTEARSSKE